MYAEVLVPIDGSEASTVAVDQGVAIANQFGGQVHFLNVVDVGTEMAASGVGNIADDLTESFEEVAAEAFSAAEAKADEAGIPYERKILEGLPHEAIAKYSVEHDIDLIVLGASGHSGLKEHLLGSTTDRVAQSAETSVLIARS